MRSIYAALDLVTFPTRDRGLGGPSSKAGAAGVAVVAGGSADGAGIVIPNKTGILLRDVAPEPLARALASLIEDSTLRGRLCAGSRAHAAERFSRPSRSAAAVESVYADVLGEKALSGAAATDGYNG